MKEIKGNLFFQIADAICITTNGYVKTNGNAVMGRGCAYEASKRWPEFPELLGQAIYHLGNVVHPFYFDNDKGREIVITFPVKHTWHEKADIALIKQSAEQLIETLDRLHLNLVVLPRPGCGNGGLVWEEVKPIISPILDDRVSVITF